MITVWATHRFVAWHSWPGAPERRAYLRDDHRHVFHVKAEVEVTHDDRDVEFHELLDIVVRAVEDMGHGCRWLGREGGGPNLGARSCEMIAAEIGAPLRYAYPEAFISVEVSEDGENGSYVEVLP